MNKQCKVLENNSINSAFSSEDAVSKKLFEAALWSERSISSGMIDESTDSAFGYLSVQNIELLEKISKEGKKIEIDISNADKNNIFLFNTLKNKNFLKMALLEVEPINVQIKEEGAMLYVYIILYPNVRLI